MLKVDFLEWRLITMLCESYLRMVGDMGETPEMRNAVEEVRKFYFETKDRILERTFSDD